MKLCTFAGHANIYGDEEAIRLKLKNEIIKLIEKENATTFYSGGKGDFDWLCAGTLKELKKDYPNIKSYLMLAYMPKEKSKYGECIAQIFDDTVYPDIENVPLRFAIVKRNECMVDKSDFLIAYVNHSWGGAYKTLEYAKKKKHIKVINIK